jgi:hypothetical protein
MDITKQQFSIYNLQGYHEECNNNLVSLKNKRSECLQSATFILGGPPFPKSCQMLVLLDKMPSLYDKPTKEVNSLNKNVHIRVHVDKLTIKLLSKPSNRLHMPNNIPVQILEQGKHGKN